MKIMYLTILAISLVSLSVQKSHAQNAGIYINDVSGFPIRPGAVASDISGTSYLNREWQLGTVSGKSGKIYKNMLLKLDLLDHKFVFKGDKGETMGFVDPVQQVVFDPTILNTSSVIFRNGFSNTEVKPTDYLEVMAEGNIRLLKKITISVKEIKDYSSAVTEKSYVTKSTYYVAQQDNALQNVSLNKKDIIKALPAHTKEIEQYIKDNKVNFRKDEDLTKLVNYYNSL